MGVAGDLLSAAVTLGDRRAEILAIAWDVETKTPLPLQKIMCEDIRANEKRRESNRFDVQATEGGERVQILRRVLAVEPRNALRWVDLALEHLVLGHPKKSTKAMRIAMNLGPHNRFVLRSASALLVELGEMDRALAVLGQSPQSSSDPWLVAPQIAIADLARMKQTAVRAAHSVLDADHPPMHLAELRAALGTVQLSAGSSRRGRQLLRGSLEAPTENSLAQVEWSDQRTQDLDPIIGEMPENVPRAFEALARRAIYEAQWIEGLKHCGNWRRDQPFSVEPYVWEGFCACEAEDWVRAISTCEKGLTFHRHNLYLLNNLAFAQIGNGRLREAHETLLEARRLAGGDDAKLTLAATEAMWLFRIGEVAEGHKRYNTVIRLFAKTHRRDDAARAALMLAQEERYVGSDFADESWNRATDLVRQSSKAPQVIRLQERIEKVPPANIAYRDVSRIPVELLSARIAMLNCPELEEV